MMLSVLLIGHISTDIRSGMELQGGPPQYQIPILKHFGFNIHVITSCVPNHEFLNSRGLKIDYLPSSHNTTFEFFPKTDENSSEDRILYLRSKACKLKNIDDLLMEHYDICIVSPIATELDKAEMEYICSISDYSYLDIQGIARQIEPDGLVTHALSDDKFQWAMRTFSVIKASKSEVDGLKLVNFNKSYLIITNSGKSIEIYSDSRKLILNTIPKENIIDSTGSGDIFLSSLAGYLINYDILTSISKADKISRRALSIQGIPNPDQVNILFE